MVDMFTVRGTKFKQQLQTMQAEFSGKRISAKITVPPEMLWWYWQEFGTASFAERGTTAPSGYEVPSLANQVEGKYLYFVSRQDGAAHIRHSVFVLGIPAKHMVTLSIPDIQKRVKEDTAIALKQGGYDFNYLRDYFISQTMPAIKEIIRQSFQDQLATTTRETGRLDVTAAEEFEAKAEIIDLT
jgi:hypothetical protein